MNNNDPYDDHCDDPYYLGLYETYVIWYSKTIYEQVNDEQVNDPDYGGMNMEAKRLVRLTNE